MALSARSPIAEDFDVLWYVEYTTPNMERVEPITVCMHVKESSLVKMAERIAGLRQHPFDHVQIVTAYIKGYK